MKRFFSALLCAAALTGTLAVPAAGAASTDATLRVGLTVGGASSFATPMLENVSGESTGYTVGTVSGTTFKSAASLASSQLTIRLNDKNAFEVCDTETGKVLFTSAEGLEQLAIRPNSRLTWFKGYKWYGDFVYRRASNGNITVINYVNVEDYVKGVLPYEIDPDWPADAQKAQAVCTRSFALGTHKHTDSGYDLCNTTNCQVYLGATRATSESDAAVSATAGETLSCDGKEVIGYFFSSDGGATEDAANVWGGEYSYLKGKADPYEEKGKDKWSVTLTPAEVKTKLTNAGYSIGTVAKVEVTKRTATNNVAEVTVTDTAGKTVTLTRSSVRTVFGLKSINYSITANAAAMSSQTKTAVQKTASAAKTSVKISPSVHTVTVDGKVVKPQGYNINDNNYYKLRDVAWILNGTGSEFNVTWDGANNRILLSPNAPYVKVGGEMSDTVAAVKKLSPSTAAVAVGNKTVQLTGYNVNDNNYYKLRDIGDALGFAVDWDPEGVVVIRSADKTTDDSKNDTSDGNNGGNSSSDQNNSNNNTGNDGQTAETAASWTFSGAGWGHSVGMSQWGAYAMAKQGFSYEDILKFYFTGIEVGSCAANPARYCALIQR